MIHRAGWDSREISWEKRGSADASDKKCPSWLPRFKGQLGVVLATERDGWICPRLPGSRTHRAEAASILSDITHHELKD